MAALSATQMNVRIDASLKEAGDDALSSIGFTPTQAVRALWEKAAKRGEHLQDVHRLLSDSAQGEKHESSKTAALEAGRRIIPDALEALGISEETIASVELDYDVLKEEAMLERAQLKGWL